MKNPRHVHLLLNLIGVVGAAVGIGYVAYSVWQTNAVEPCSSRFPAPTRLPLARPDGTQLTAIDLQARAGRHNLGVLQNASVVPSQGGPAPEALEIRLRDLPAGEAHPGARNGIAFRWVPPGLKEATSTCISYGLWLPDRFEFGEGGLLPGVFGADSATAGANTPPVDRLSGQPEWNRAGKPTLVALLEGGTLARISGAKSALPTNRWLRIEQEAALNTPGKSDGLLRLWVNGELVLEGRNVAWRRDAGAGFSGALLATGYRLSNPQPGLLRLSLIELAWK